MTIENAASESNAFVSWLRKFRRERRLSQSALLEDINQVLVNQNERPIDQSTLSKVLSGRRNAPPERLIRAVAVLAHEPVDDLVELVHRRVVGELDTVALQIAGSRPSQANIVSVSCGHYLMAAPVVLAGISDDKPTIATQFDTAMRQATLRIATYGRNSPNGVIPCFWQNAPLSAALIGDVPLTALDVARSLSPKASGSETADIAFVPGILLDRPEMKGARLIKIAELVSSEYACEYISEGDGAVSDLARALDISSKADSSQNRLRSKSDSNHYQLTTNALGELLTAARKQLLDKGTPHEPVIAVDVGTFTEDILHLALGASTIECDEIPVFLSNNVQATPTNQLLKEPPRGLAGGILTWEPFATLVKRLYTNASDTAFSASIYLSPDYAGRPQHHSYAAVIHEDSLPDLRTVNRAIYLRRLQAVLEQISNAAAALNEWTSKAKTLAEHPDSRNVGLQMRFRNLAEYFFSIVNPRDEVKSSPCECKVDALNDLFPSIKRTSFSITTTLEFAQLLCESLPT